MADSIHPRVPLATPVPHATRERVLVVDDERAVRYLIRTILGRMGYDVSEAAGPGAADAWLAAEHEPIDLLITDIVMPGESGPELYRRLAKARPSLRVLYISGYADDALERERLVDAGAAFVQKPFTAEGLSRTVRDVLDRKPRRAGA